MKGRDHKSSFTRCKHQNSQIGEKLFTRPRVLLKIFNQQNEIHTATAFAFESDVFLHSDVERDCSACRMGLFALRMVRLRWSSMGPPSVACEGEKFRFIRSLFRSA
jgi:hypothetical protein